ncbi:MAG: hypothetical protein ACK457_09180 [Flavobacteriia bacterium]
MSENELELYNQQFHHLKNLVGKTIYEIVFYLEETDETQTEQPNKFGKSLLNGIDLKVGKVYYSIGCRFSDSHYGLSIAPGRTTEFEDIEEEKRPIKFASKLIGQEIKSVEIFWMKIPWVDEMGHYPQEFVIRTDNSFLLLSSIEINDGEVNTEFTDELLVVESEEIAKQLQLGPFGLGENGREYFKNFKEFKESTKKTWG